VGLHVALSFPTPAQLPAVPELERFASTPGVNAPVPVVAEAAPELYAIEAFATVSFALAPPVVKVVDETDEVQVATSAPRVSVTVTAPSWPETDELPVATLPRFAEAGTLTLSDPAAIVNVVDVSPGAAAAGPTATASTTSVAMAIAVILFVLT